MAKYVTIQVTPRQARLMADAVWNLQCDRDLLAEWSRSNLRQTVQDKLMLAELRRRLYMVAGGSPTQELTDSEAAAEEATWD